MRSKFLLPAAIAAATVASPALAKTGDPIKLDEEVTFDPIVDLNLRYEVVDQANIANEASAATVRLRLGGEMKWKNFSFLAEGEGTVAFSDHYNDTLPFNGAEPYPTVADPENIELNRLQVGYMKEGTGVIVGRQRIVLDNARFVGNVGWRQNEQTFDAVRGQAKLGPVKLDATFATAQRTIFGYKSPNEHFDGDIVLLNASGDFKPVKVVAFAYLLDFDTRVAFSSNTYGALVTAAVPLADKLTLNLLASAATQSDAGSNPVSYSAEYFNFEAGLGAGDFTGKLGYEELGSDSGVASFQTPLATLHAWNGWADLFLTTPAAGLRDYYASASYKFSKFKALPGLTLTAVYHAYENDTTGAGYGSEINASLGCKIDIVSLLVKYANYDADGFGANTEKLWLQAGIAF